MAHTPGPWTFRRFYNRSEHVVTDQWTMDGQFIGQVIASKTTCPDWQDNARLIAAAPELLEAANYALGKLQALCRLGRTDPGIAEESLLAAIAKATEATP